MNEVLLKQHMHFRKKAYFAMFLFALFFGLFFAVDSATSKFAMMFVAGFVFNKLLIGISGVKITFKILKANESGEDEETQE